MMARDNTIRFQVVAPDGRCSDVWRAWNVRNDVYLAPRDKGGEFKISLHASGKWRLAFTKEYAERMRSLRTWDSNRCVESLDRPLVCAAGFTRAVRVYFPDSELRTSSRVHPRPGEIIQIPGPPNEGLLIVDLIFTTAASRFTQTDSPLRGSLGAERMARWTTPNGETVWLVHFELAGLRGLDHQAGWFRSNFAAAKKLDERRSAYAQEPGRIMIAGTNDQGWFCVIDAALWT